MSKKNHKNGLSTIRIQPLATLKKLELLRKKIDKLDNRLIELLKRRFQIVEQIGTLKKNNGIPIFQKSRWTQLLRDRLKLAQTTNRKSDGRPVISSLFIRDIFTIIHSESLDLQERIKKTKIQGESINIQ